MRLASIKLAGFKSFVDPTTLTLTSNLTSVVGPNGCGKSNVIDAVRWVTGESSARQLRGEALEDVIFNGSKARKPVGRASVELKFDNSDGKLGGQYAGFAEISIRRELARDGGSKYFINGTRARRRDVIDLFLGTGLGGRSNYAVIEQGAVNRLIEARPEDMRQVLEEAAGISKYKERRRETENRIRHTRENLDRLNDVIRAVTQRLGALKRQAANAEKYKTLKADERRLRAELLALRWQAQSNAVEAAEQTLRDVESRLSRAVSARREAEQARSDEAAAQQLAMNEVQSQQATFYDAQSRVGRIEQALAHARELQEMRTRERTELVQRLDSLTRREAEEEHVQARVEAEQQTLASERDAAAGTRDTARAALESAEKRAAEAESAWDELNSAEHNPVQQLDAERTRHRYAEQQLAQLLERDKARRAELERMQSVDMAGLDAVEKDLAARNDSLVADREAAQAAGQQSDQLRADIREREQSLDVLRTALGEQQAQLASERKMQQAVLREDDAAIAEWLAAQGQSGARGVARRVRVKKAWRAAAEAGLGPLLRGFTVGALPAITGAWPDDALALIEDRPAAADAAPPSLGGAPSLADGLDGPAAIKALASRLFVVDDLEAALALRDQLAAGQQLVTLDGCRVGSDTLITPVGQAAETGVLDREQRIEQLAAEVETGQADYERAEQALNEQRGAQQQAREYREALDRRIGEQQRALESDSAAHQGERMRARQIETRRAEIDAELEALSEQIEAAHAQQQRAVEAVDALEIRASQFSQARRQTQTTLAEARAERDRARKATHECEREMAALESRQSQTSSRCEAATVRIADTRAARDDVQARLEAFDAAADDSQNVSEDDDLEAARETQTRADRELRAARDELGRREQALKASGQALMQAEQQVESARDALQQAKIEVETADVRRQGVAEQLEELGETPAAVAKRLPEDAAIERWNQEIEGVERKIARLGAINLAAIEEYDSEAERESYLSAQHADLTEALETLESAIAKIDRETRQRFKATYEQVNARFSQMFPELFGGGDAALELTEDDWLATGIRVMARPPGKRNASIQMLSGGEKALTAVALLFALFELNPAPFCMLDEIDAPLDDANVSRFCELVRRISTQVQFIVITHNKLTMELAEQLHGVTMAEPGVSRLVSVDIAQALDMAG